MLAYQLGWMNLILHWENQEQQIIELIDSYTDVELFQQGGRKWSSSTPSNWTIWKWEKLQQR